MDENSIIGYVWVYSREILLILCNLSYSIQNFCFFSKQIWELGIVSDQLLCKESLTSSDSLSISKLIPNESYNLNLCSFDWYLGRFSIDIE